MLMLNSLNANCHYLRVDDCTVLFSYGVPVALYDPTRGFFITSYKWSPTTSRHINNFLETRSEYAYQKVFVPQQVLSEGTLLLNPPLRQRFLNEHNERLATINAQL